jgi:hypothetical protein
MSKTQLDGFLQLFAEAADEDWPDLSYQQLYKNTVHHVNHLEKANTGSQPKLSHAIKKHYGIDFHDDTVTLQRDLHPSKG